MADTPKHSVSVAGIVVDDQDRVLVIKRRDNGHWEPPGGVLELNESPQAGVTREVLEETGVLVEAESLSGVYKNMPAGIVALVFRCRSTGGSTAAVTTEAMTVQWRHLDDLRAEMSEAYIVRISDALADGPTAVRAHDGQQLLNVVVSQTY